MEEYQVNNTSIKGGCLIKLATIICTLFVQIFTTYIVSGWIKDVWNIDSGGSIFLNEREFISFFYTWPIFSALLLLLTFAIRSKLQQYYSTVLITQIVLLVVSLFTCAVILGA